MASPHPSQTDVSDYMDAEDAMDIEEARTPRGASPDPWAATPEPSLDAMFNSEFESMRNQLFIDHQHAQEALRHIIPPTSQNPPGPSTRYQGGRPPDGSAIISTEQISDGGDRESSASGSSYTPSTDGESSDTQTQGTNVTTEHEYTGAGDDYEDPNPDSSQPGSYSNGPQQYVPDPDPDHMETDHQPGSSSNGPRRYEPNTDHANFNPDMPATRRDFVEMTRCIGDLSSAVQKTAEVNKRIFDLLLSEQAKANPGLPRRRSTSNSNNGGEGDYDADDDDDSPSAPRMTGPPKRRKAGDNRLAEDVRQHARSLMFRESTDSPFDLASREEIDNWTARPDGEAASSVFFKPDLDAPPGTPWNRSHVRVFVRTFLDADTFECVNQERIKRAFISHLKALRQKYKIQQSSHEEQAQRQDRANRDERKRNVCIFCFHPSVLP
ncbi:hypothetical protein EYR40_005873 [Pleurotus pulmonarius]|nr:hypothetical protein EYR40_005873 [Pleurotus pulmonarius]